MSIIWRKLWRDLWRSKLRTSLIVISTAMGVFSLGFVYGAGDVLDTRLTQSHRASVPAHVTLYTGRFGEEVVEIVQEQAGVADAEGEATTRIRWKLPGESEWRDANVIARSDFETQRMGLIDLLEGAWPSERRLAAEGMTLRQFGIPLGGEVIVEFGRGERRLVVTGVVRHPQAAPPPLGEPVFLATMDTIAWLAGEPVGFNRLNLRLDAFDEERAGEVAELVQDRLERMGIGVGFYAVSDPEVHPIQETLDALQQILAVLGVLSLGLAGFLIVNMMNAIVAQEVWQIGVMKVVGATRARIMRIYLAMALVYGSLSLILAVPLAAVAAYLVTGLLLDLVNVPRGSLGFTPTALVIQLAIGLIMPIVAALVPVLSAARITPHRAISSYGLGAGFGRHWLDRLIGRIRRLPRPLALSLRNTFRRKARIALTMTTLVLGGVMFMVVVSVSASMNNTLELLIDELGFDVIAGFGRAHRVQRLVSVAESVPGVSHAEVWNQVPAQISLPGGDKFDGFIWGVPADSEMFKPRVISGRALLPGDGRAILLNSKIADDEGFQVGDVITVTVLEREATWTVVGLALNVNNQQRESFVPFDALARTLGSVGRGGLVMLEAEDDTVATQERLVHDLRAAYTEQRMEPTYFESAAQARERNQVQFNVITYLMMAMAILAAAVGSIGLMSVMSVNVVERRREIGVMRAIGARSETILGIFVTEGVLVGVLSWLLAVPLSYPVARLFNDMVSRTIFRVPLDFYYAVNGAVGWLAIAVVLSAVASLWPALKAAQVSVREVLAYE
jgi:putative ABC transport system permease protein